MENVAKYFESHPLKDAVHQTSDSLLFHEHSDAVNHGKSLELKGVKTHLKSDLTEEIKPLVNSDFEIKKEEKELSEGEAFLTEMWIKKLKTANYLVLREDEIKVFIDTIKELHLAEINAAFLDEMVKVKDEINYEEISQIIEPETLPEIAKPEIKKVIKKNKGLPIQ